MTTQAGAAVATAAEQPPTPKRVRGQRKIGDLLLRIVAGLVLLYLFLPIFIIILFSFNKPAGKFNYTWQGFTLNNWAHPFKYPALTDALKLSINIAAVSTAIALVFGTLLAIALVRQRFRGQSAVDTFLVLPLTAPEVVIGAALLTLFLDLGWAAGYTTIVIAHVAFEISFIAMTVRARMRGFDWTLEDASMDLGASPTRTFFKVTLPLIIPGIVAAAHVVVRAVARRLHHHVLCQRVDGDLSAVRERGGEGRRPPADQRAGDCDPGNQPAFARRGNAVPAQANRGLVQPDCDRYAALPVALATACPMRS